MPTVITQGAASAKGYGFGARATAANYIEDVFSTYLYTGNGSTQTITNGIDLSTKGGLVWAKERSATGTSHQLRDTVRGGNKAIYSNALSGQSTASGAYTFNSNGYTIGGNDDINLNTKTYVSWTFRKQAKFFDVVTYTGDGQTSRSIAHNLGTTPGCVIIKKTSDVSDWTIWHRSLTGSNPYMWFSTDDTVTDYVTSLTPNSTTFKVGDTQATYSTTNASGNQYVAYLFAHDAGGFGASGSDNVISCGSYTGNGSTTGTTVALGYEPQWLLIKRSAGGSGDWNLIDNMRGFVVGGTDAELNPNLASGESTGTFVTPTATGFQLNTTDVGYNASGNTYIYIAIRRGPMKTPTSGTSVYNAIARTGTGAAATVTGVGFSPDFMLVKGRSSGTEGVIRDRLRGTNPALRPSTTNAESSTTTNGLTSYNMDGVTLGADNTGTDVNGQTNGNGTTFINWFFRRAPGFFDVVCYTGTNTTGQSINHNLGVVPEFYVCKRRDATEGADAWQVYCSYLSSPLNSYLRLYLSDANGVNTDAWQTPTATQIKIGAGLKGYANALNGTYVAYLFATVAGVSKVGSYTGTGTTKQIDCGFTGGARFVLIKRTDSTGDWYVWDSARGIVAGNDPYLRLNNVSPATEVTNTDYIDTYSAGFEISSTAPAAINANGGSFIFLAIA